MPVPPSLRWRRAALALALAAACSGEQKRQVPLEADCQIPFGTAMHHVAQGDTQRALGLLEQARTLCPGNVQITHALGQTYAAAEQYGRALELVDQALASSEGDPAILNTRGSIYLRQKRYDAAIADFRAALEPARKYGTPSFAHYNLAEALAAKGELGPAIAAYRESLGYSALDPHVRTRLCATLLANRQVDEAFAECDRVTRTHPSFAEGWYQLGLVELGRGSNVEARDAFERALQLAPRSSPLVNDIKKYLELLRPPPARR